MWPKIRLLSGSFAAVLQLAQAWNHDAQLPVVTGNQIPPYVESELGALLSNNTTILVPKDPEWSQATERYQTFGRPHIQLLVRPGRESDVPTIIRYANENGIDFFVVNRGHSLTSTTAQFNGIQIDMTSLGEISINRENSTARLGGGAFNYDVIKTLWDQGYATTTGSCLCVGLMGPALGGGHGIQQGKHGLISDSLVQMDVVLADGSAVSVSEDSHPDLWWAMRGAGHNFGLVTSFEMKIHPITVPQYYWRQYAFSGKVVEPLFEALNEFHNNGTLTSEFGGSFGVYAFDPQVSKSEAMIAWIFIYAGPKEEAEKMLAPFDKIEAMGRQEGNVDLVGVSDVLFSGLDSDLCKPDFSHLIGTAGLQVYNTTTQRQLYELFNSKIAQNPELAAATRLVHEGYAVEGVRSRHGPDSAFPLRDDYLLMYFDSTLEKDSKYEDAARAWAQESVDMWNAGQPKRLPTTYVNYAAGHESLESMYGYEPWRLGKLRELKGKYDPQNRFGYYNPIFPPQGAEGFMPQEI